MPFIDKRKNAVRVEGIKFQFSHIKHEISWDKKAVGYESLELREEVQAGDKMEIIINIMKVFESMGTDKLTLGEW